MSVPVVTVAQMREWEAATWATGQTEAAVIQRVGQWIAYRALQLTRPGDAILVLAGKGNNGNDARAAIGHLADRQVELLNVHSPDVIFARFAELLATRNFSLIIDGLFGIGLNRPLDDHWQQLVAAVNGCNIPVLAVDVPSGLNADTGEIFGAAIEAAITLTVGGPKAGMLAQAAWKYVGRLEVLDDVGLAPFPGGSEWQWTLPDDFRNFPPRRMAAGHKGSYGHLAVVAGSFGFHGAAVLAARGAQRAQPGLITVYPQPDVHPLVAVQLQSPMVDVWRPDVRLYDRATAVVIGPGLAAIDPPDDMRNVLRRLWRDSELPIIVDASALDWLTAQSGPRNAIRCLTPHPGEAARMLNSTADKVQADRPQALRELSRRYGNCHVVLKGHQTLVGRGDGEIFVNPSGNPHLAQGGSGDVLAGFIAGFLAQPELRVDPLKTIRYAVWRHGKAADELQALGKSWVVEDLIEEL